MRIAVPALVYDFLPDLPAGLKKDKILYVLAEIFSPSAEQLEHHDEMKKIYAHEWKATIGNNYTDYINYLTNDYEVIDVCRHYEPKKYPMKYAIKDGWDINPVIVDIQDLILCRKLNNRITAPEYHNNPTLDRWIYDNKLTIAEDALPKFYPTMTYKSSQDDISPLGKIHDINTILKFENGWVTGKRDHTSGRYHSTVSLASKRIRSYIRYNGNPLVEIDITSCQPFLSLVLFEDWFYENNAKLNLTKLISLKHLSTQSSNQIKHNNSLYKITKTLLPSDYHDIKVYRESILSGQVYEWLMDLMKQKAGWDINREEAKKAFCYTIYSGESESVPPWAKREIKLYNNVKKILIHAVPGVFRIINSYKKCGNEVLPIILQRIESYIIIDRAAKCIPNNVPFFTIHDSILTLPEHVQMVKEIIEDEFLLATGIKPSIKVK